MFIGTTGHSSQTTPTLGIILSQPQHCSYLHTDSCHTLQHYTQLQIYITHTLHTATDATTHYTHIWHIASLHTAHSYRYNYTLYPPLARSRRSWCRARGWRSRPSQTPGLGTQGALQDAYSQELSRHSDTGSLQPEAALTKSRKISIEKRRDISA